METQERMEVLTGREGAEIDIKVASEWTKNHRHRTPGGVVSQFFGQEIINRILQQPGCIGIRFYYANAKPVSGWQRFVKRCFATSEGEVHLIMAGVTKDGEDQLPGSGQHIEAFALKTTAAASGTSSNILGEQSVPCPGGAGCPTNTLTGA
jgi:hypothetical protein